MNKDDITIEYYRKWDSLKRQDEEAKKAGTLVGRYIKEPYADGYAVYVITKVLKNSVKAVAQTDLGDGWVIPYWGVNATIGRKYVENSIKQREKRYEIFSKLFDEL